MKNQGKNRIAILMALTVFVMCILTGCSAKNGDSKNETNAQTNSQSQETTEESTESQSQEETTQKPKDVETIGAIAIVDNAAYEYYNFVQSAADSYVGIINSAAKKLSADTVMYSIIVPTSIDITLDSATRSRINTSDQQKAINYLYGSMSTKVKTVNLFEALCSHKAEYIYYRTDHHWTALGAYYGYVEFAKAAGFEPVELNKFDRQSYGKFLGSFYSDSKKDSKLEKNADELIAYKPYYTAKLTYTDKNGQKINWPLVNDVTTYPESLKYSAFAAGDNPYTVIENSDNENGKTCVIIKESFANAMIPFIVGNYKTVHVIDYRYWKGKLSDFVTNNGVDDVIFINNISATRNTSLIDSLADMI